MLTFNIHDKSQKEQCSVQKDTLGGNVNHFEVVTFLFVCVCVCLCVHVKVCAGTHICGYRCRGQRLASGAIP